MKKIAIIGASDFQNPLILKAKEKGAETHVFAWECGDIGEKTADHFYPISITEIDQILAKCKEIGIDGICSIGSDLANITVSKVASELGLCANSVESVVRSTDKHAMRDCFAEHGDPSPRSMVVSRGFDLAASGLSCPLIVKPADRSGSRGITRLDSPEGFQEAVSSAKSESFSQVVLVEEFAEGAEYSVEYISWQGQHHFIALTEKFTTGAPSFIETGHLEPARLDSTTVNAVKAVVEHALDSLGVEYGASHSEVKIDEKGKIAIIEIGSRMGGDCIGSHLVELSTGYDFVGAVVDVALGVEPARPCDSADRYAAIRFVFSEDDLRGLALMKESNPGAVKFVSEIDVSHDKITDSSSRYGFYIVASETLEEIATILP